MSKYATTFWKLSIGLLTVILFVYLCSFLGYFVFLVVTPSQPDFDSFIIFFSLHLVVSVVAQVLLIFFVVHACRNQDLTGRELTQWIVLLLVGNVVAMPIYWYWYVWKKGVSDQQRR